MIAKKKQSLEVFVNKLFPFDNPNESYSFYSLPFCQPKSIKELPLTLGETLSGVRKFNSLYKLEVGADVSKHVLCHKKLSLVDLGEFKAAID